MMATEEPSFAKLADVPTALDSRPAHKARHVTSDSLEANGNFLMTNDDITNKLILRVGEHSNSADASVSGGSDTEASRTDWARQRNGVKRLVHTGSAVKKPAIFKAVSVNKTFLASKASPSNTTSKTSDKPTKGTSTPPLGSSTLSSSRPRLVAKSGSGVRDSSPRLSSAVNGVKLATAPDPSGVWNKNRPPEPKKFTDEELKKYGIHMANRLNEDDTQGQNKWADIEDDDDDWAPQAITWGDGTKTTLPHPDEPVAATSVNGDCGSAKSLEKIQEKPRSPVLAAASTWSTLPGSSSIAPSKGLVLKSTLLDKPAFVAKQSAPPALVKSPWATLPPVDRVSPNSASASIIVRRPIKETPKSSTVQPREIAADDFSRSSWRDALSHGSRELFNSHSGRYEPVTDRRTSDRLDPPSRKPALLHRPTPIDQSAEPYRAIQSNRTSQEVPLVRRRGSSNVSGGSGSYSHRFGIESEGPAPPAAEQLGASTSSLVGSVASPVYSDMFPVSNHGPSAHQSSQGLGSGKSPVTALALAKPHGCHLVPKAKAEPHLPAESSVSDDVEYQRRLMRERVELARKRRQEEEAREETAKKERIQKKIEALGPAPDKKSDKKVVPREDSLRLTNVKHQKSPYLPSQTIDQERHIDSEANYLSLHDAAGTNAITMAVKDGPPPGPQASRLSHGQEGSTDLWVSSGPRSERFIPWTAGVSLTSRNVWGSPDNDRGLGNGTFNPDLGRVSGTAVAPPQSHQSQSPIALPKNARRLSQAQSQTPHPIGTQDSRYGASGSDLAKKWVAAVADGDKKISAARLVARTGKERQLAEQGLSIEDAQPAIKDTWRPVQLPGDGTRRVVRAVEVQSHASGPWKMPQEKYAKEMTAGEDPTLTANAGIIGPVSGPLLSQAGSGAPQSRASRFFPSKDVRHEVGFAASEPSCPNSPSIPPPTMEGHPAYEGDVMRPHVSLPKPQPVVKSPTSRVSLPPHQLRNIIARRQSRVSLKDISRTSLSHGPVSCREGDFTRGFWQEKIDNLLNGGRSLTSKHIGGDPTSRSLLEPLGYEDWATASLSSLSTTTHANRISKCRISKPMAEECFEEQEMGSLPHIRLPHKAPEAAWQPAIAQNKPLPKRLLVQASEMDPYLLAADVAGGGNVMKVMLPGMIEAKHLTIPVEATRASQNDHARPSSRHQSGSRGSRGNKREIAHSLKCKSSAICSSTRGSRSNRKKGGDSWTRQQNECACASKKPIRITCVTETWPLSSTAGFGTGLSKMSSVNSFT